jgi:hypothetical protein
VSSSLASPPVSQETQRSTSVGVLPSSQVASSSRAGSTSQRPERSPNTLSTLPNSPTVSPSNNQQSSASPSASPSSGDNNSPQTTPEAESSVTQQVIYKTTLPGGAVTTITSITVVPAEGEATATGRSTPTKTRAGNAGLQTGAATRERSGINAAFIGALGMAAAAAL